MKLVTRQPFEWDQYDTVLLDMDGTLLDLRFDNYFWQELVPSRYAALKGLPHAEAVALLEPRFAAARGTLEWYCLDHWSRELGIDVAALKREAEDHIDFLPDVPDFLVAVRELRKRAVLVTNAHRGSLAVKLERTGLERYVDAIHSSHDIGIPKEDAAFWARLRVIEPFEPARTLLVDDSLPVLRAAHTYGIGRVVAILRPDSSRPPNAVEDFHGVESVTELLQRRPPQGKS
jgi:5'-nucleotidase